MILYVVKFKRNFLPRQIAYKSYDQAVRICGHFNLPRRNISVLYFEQDEKKISFGENHERRAE